MLRRSTPAQNVKVVKGSISEVMEEGFYYLVEVGALRRGYVVEGPTVVFGQPNDVTSIDIDSLGKAVAVVGDVRSIIARLGHPLKAVVTTPENAAQAFLAGASTFLWSRAGPIFLPPEYVVVGNDMVLKIPEAFRAFPVLHKSDDMSVRYGPFAFRGRDEVDLIGYIGFIDKLVSELGHGIVKATVLMGRTQVMYEWMAKAERGELLPVVFSGERFFVLSPNPPITEVLSSVYDEEEGEAVLDTFMEQNTSAMIEYGFSRVIENLSLPPYSMEYLKYIKDAIKRVSRIKEQYKYSVVPPSLKLGAVENIADVDEETLTRLEIASATNIANAKIIALEKKDSMTEYVIVRDGATFVGVAVDLPGLVPPPMEISGFREFDDAMRGYAGISDEEADELVKLLREKVIRTSKKLGHDVKEVYAYALLGRVQALAEIHSS